MAVTAAKTKRSAEREALAEAIERRDAAAAVLEAATARLAEFDGKLSETRRTWYDADNALDEAKEFLRNTLRLCAGNEADAAAHAIRTRREPPREALAAAERAYAQSKEALDLAEEGRARLAGAKIVADDDHRWGVEHVRKAVETACHLSLPHVLAEAEKARSAFLAATTVLRNVSRDYDGVGSNTRSDDPLAVRIRSMFGSPFIDHNEHANLAPWVAVREALASDADAELPR